MDKRLGVCYEWNIEEGGTELRWSQSEVVDISNGSNILKPGVHILAYSNKGEAVTIRWDEDIYISEISRVSSQRLLPSKWNSKKEYSNGAWRFDVKK